MATSTPRPPGEVLDLFNNVVLLVKSKDCIGTHLPRHFYADRICLDCNDQARALGFAPAVAHSPIGLVKNGDGVPDL